ncbi:MAG TPA: membrane protein insertion efficiency factor YidD [Syntrophobacteraceae bacterium]|nr:membrane protein insertion efficiency factor YidD [Syntrophobacteraceae bacterium]
MIRSFFLLAIRSYQTLLSPWMGPCCRFVPTCSQYTYEAVQLHGPWKGCLLGLGRIARCHPFHPGGYDPVDPPSTTDVPTKWSFLRWKNGP